MSRLLIIAIIALITLVIAVHFARANSIQPPQPQRTTVPYMQNHSVAPAQKYVRGRGVRHCCGASQETCDADSVCNDTGEDPARFD